MRGYNTLLTPCHLARMMKKKLLIIEDELSVAKQLKWGLEKEYDITIAGEVEQAKKFLASGVFPVATLDLGLPPFPNTPQQGFALLEAVPSLAPHTRVIVITGNAEEENAVRAVALGATDFCAKPVDLQVLRIILTRTFKIQELEEVNLRLQRQGCRSGSLCGMIGISPPMNKVFELIQLAAANDYPVLITGKTGTGKEMAAKAIHQLSPRGEKPLIIINCGAIPENLLESELFGHERYLINRDFCSVPMGTFTWSSYLAVAVLFGLEHHRIVEGVVAGLLYGLLVVRQKKLAGAILAHGITNLGLGIYVIATGSWMFW